MRRALVVATGLALAGCAPLAVDRNVEDAAGMAGVQGGVRLAWDDATRAEDAKRVQGLLAAPLGREDAVKIALANDASLQARLFALAAESARATQAGRIANPVLAIERLVRREEGAREVELTRSIVVPVIALLLLPQRLAQADARQAELRYTLAGELAQRAAEVRQAWVRAVAAQQAVAYAEQVNEAAGAAAELAARMQAVGNYSRLQRAREQAFHADAAATLARTRHEAVAAREMLVRLLGLGEAQAKALRLPERLPDLPVAPRDEASVAKAALEDRIDVRAARASLDATARALGLTRVSSWVDGLHVGAVDKRESGRTPQRGFEVELPLPIFDFGGARRAEVQATYMAAMSRTSAVAIAATSQLRQGYDAYRTAYDLARHYRDEVVPLRKTIADEVLLRYNGMLASVFELLADAREQASAVRQALDAQRDFWLADAALDASLLGRPLDAAFPTTTSAAPAAASPASH